MILYGYHQYIPEKQMWQIPKQGPKAPYHARSLPNTPSRVSKEQQSGSHQELVQVDNTGNRWKCLLLAGDNQESPLTCSKMLGRPRRATKSSEHPFSLPADHWKQDTLTSWQGNQRIWAEKGICKFPTFVVLRSLKEKVPWEVQFNTAALVTTWEMVIEGSLNSQKKHASFVLQNLAQKKWIVPSESCWCINRIQPSVSSLGLSAKAELKRCCTWHTTYPWGHPR